jgi:multidrug resistance efflux pump
MRSRRSSAYRAVCVAAAATALLGADLATCAGRDSAAPEARERASEGAPSLEAIGALGRIEPRNGVVRVAGPPRPAVVIERLFVDEGDRVRRGQELAALAGIGVQLAAVERLRAELANAERELERRSALRRGAVLSDAEWETLRLARDVARARLAGAEAELALSTVRSPIDGEVLDVHAREGERVGADGIAEVGDTSAMYAVAEVYETDAARVRAGQRARVSSVALAGEVEGVVERVGRKIGKQDTLSTDPVADVDSRVVEVRVRIADAERASGLTNARVEVVIQP